MGTSSSYTGPGTGNPLIPSWLDGAPGNPDDGAPGSDQGNQQDPNRDGQNGTSQPPVQSLPAPFKGAKGTVSRFAGSGGAGGGGSIRRTVSSYVSKSSGGPAKAASRMGASRAAAGRLLGFLADAQARGVDQALKSINLDSLVGKPLVDLFFGLADYICPVEGTVDAGIARDAYAETVAELVEGGVSSLNSMTNEQLMVAMESFMANSIFNRLCNDIGAGVVQLAKDPKAVESIQGQMKEFIRGAVHDALDKQFKGNRELSKGDGAKMSRDLYEQAFSILASYSKKSK